MDAIKNWIEAANAVGKPMGRGTSWCFYAPYYSTKPNGPSTEHYIISND